MFGISMHLRAGYHRPWVDGPQSFIDLSRVRQSAHVRITRCKDAVCWRKLRFILYFEQQLWYRFLELPHYEISRAQIAQHKAEASTRAEPLRDVQMLYRGFRLSGPRPYYTSVVPTSCKARIPGGRPI